MGMTGLRGLLAYCYVVVVGASLTLLTACGGLSIGGVSTAPIDTPAKKLYAAEQAYKAAVTSIEQWTDAGYIKGPAALNVDATMRSARAALDAWQERPYDNSAMSIADTSMAALTRIVDIWAQTVTARKPQAFLPRDRPKVQPYPPPLSAVA